MGELHGVCGGICAKTSLMLNVWFEVWSSRWYDVCRLALTSLRCCWDNGSSGFIRCLSWTIAASLSLFGFATQSSRTLVQKRGKASLLTSGCLSIIAGPVCAINDEWAWPVIKDGNAEWMLSLGLFIVGVGCVSCIESLGGGEVIGVQETAGVPVNAEDYGWGFFIRCCDVKSEIL